MQYLFSVLDDATELGAEGSNCCNRKVEVRPFHSE
jgi:hypothetical protein